MNKKGNLINKAYNENKKAIMKDLLVSPLISEIVVPLQ